MEITLLSGQEKKSLTNKYDHGKSKVLHEKVNHFCIFCGPTTRLLILSKP